MGPVNPPTPKSTNAIGVQPGLPRANTENNLRRRTFGNGSALNGAALSSRTMIARNSEVRVPRSSTFQHLRRRREVPPPVPPIPEKFKSSLRAKVPFDVGGESGKVTSAIPQGRFQSTSSNTLSTLDEDDREQSMTRSSSPFIIDLEDIAGATSSVDEPSDDEVIERLPKALPRLVSRFFSATSPYSFTAKGVPYANAESSSQVKEYMPPIWWAGRFQARFDQWRNDAMQAALDPNFKPEGILGQCKLNEDKVAACYIFLQLRDLCGNKKAMDSLSVCIPGFSML
jgi:hypothetical protein